MDAVIGRRGDAEQSLLLIPVSPRSRVSVSSLSSFLFRFGGPGGTQTLTRSLQDFYAISYITSPKHLSFVIGHFPFVI